MPDLELIVGNKNYSSWSLRPWMFMRHFGIAFSDKPISLHVHKTWEFFSPGCYAKGDRTPDYQPDVYHPLIVDLLTPDVNDIDTIAVMLETIAESISDHAAFPKNNIFINHRYAHPAMVFDDGKIVRW